MALESAGALASFPLVAAVTMDGSWTVPEDQAQDEMVQFHTSVSLVGGALGMLAIGGCSWAYSVGLGLF